MSDVGTALHGAGDAQSARQPSWRQRSVEDLPDLTSMIMSMGVYEEYQKYRDGYRSWRNGAARGSQGEPTVEALAATMPPQSSFVDAVMGADYNTWQWRRTASYWISVCFLEGSLLFLGASAFAWAFARGWRVRTNEHHQEHMEKALTAWPTLFGGLFFSIGAYLMLMETEDVRQALVQESQEYTRIPYIASMAYFIGTCIYPVALVTGVFTGLNRLHILLLSALPYSIGGLLLAVGGFLECIESNVFQSKPSSMQWLVAVLNFSGGILFFVGGLVLFQTGTDLISDIVFTVGSVLYTLGSICSVVMWKDQQFGLAFLNVLNHCGVQMRPSLGTQLNNVSDEGSAFSIRGIVFIHLYCLVSVLAIFNSCISLNDLADRPCWFSATRALNEFVPFLILHVVMLLHSAVVKTPSVQPFHALVMGLRGLAFVIGASAVASFWIGVTEPPPPPPHDPPPDARLIRWS